jgi:cbb3-type cytochrome oxidase subunit 3
MKFENGNKGVGQTLSEQQGERHEAIQAPADPVLFEQKRVSPPRISSILMFAIRTLWTWIVVAITLFILAVTWLVTIREKKDLTDKNRRKNLLLIISE